VENHSAGRKPKATEELVLSVAWELFETNGYAETTMAEIAEKSGLSRRSIFNYVPSKEALLYSNDACESFVTAFSAELKKRPKDESMFDSLSQTLKTLTPEFINLPTMGNPGPQVLEARQTDAGLEYIRSYWAEKLRQVALERLADDPNAQVKARFVSALVAQTLSELGAIVRESGGKITPVKAAAKVLEILYELFG